MFGRWRKGAKGKGERTRLGDQRASQKSAASSTWAFARTCLALLARILVSAGHSPRRLAREFAEICRGLEEPKHRFDPNDLAYFGDLPHVISRWYNDPKYLDGEGEPHLLPMWGEGPSLSALIARVFPAQDPVAVAESLIQLGAVRQRGALYEAVSRHCILSDAAARLHVLSTLQGFLRTVDHNVAGGEPKLFERTVMNPSFPVSALPAFYRWLNEFGDSVAKVLDREMERHAEAVTEGPKIRVAVATFAFENPEATGLAEAGSREQLAAAGDAGERGERK